MTDQRQLVEQAAKAAIALNEARIAAQAHDERLRAAKLDAARLRQERDAAIWHLGHDWNMRSTEISRALVEQLRRQGLSDDAIADLGVSHDTVRRAVQSPL